MSNFYLFWLKYPENSEVIGPICKLTRCLTKPVNLKLTSSLISLDRPSIWGAIFKIFSSYSLTFCLYFTLCLICSLSLWRRTSLFLSVFITIKAARRNDNFGRVSFESRRVLAGKTSGSLLRFWIKQLIRTRGIIDDLYESPLVCSVSFFCICLK